MNWDLQNFNSREFIQQYWQKKPCLIKNAFVDLESPVSPEELAGLACEEEVHSRLIMEKGGESPWQLRYGPFKESDFLSLPESHYSLLVSECEKWIPEFAKLLDEFRFVPNWRIDDVMLSYAPPGGSVGPHVDEYDVFLLQVQGQRNWQYDNQRINNPALLPDLDLAILQSFNPEHDVILHPGDMLYLPPGVAHHGVAVDACMTCSIGFRAPTTTEILDSFTLEIEGNKQGNKRYSDSDLESDRHFTEITSREINHFQQMIRDLFDQPTSVWADAVGKLISDASVSDTDNPASLNCLDELQLTDWMVNPDTKMLYHKDGPSIRFYCNGNLTLLPLDKDSEQVVQQLCASHELSQDLVERCRMSLPLSELLINMANNTAIIPLEV